MPGPFIAQVAEGVPFDNTGTEFVADDVQNAMEENHTHPITAHLETKGTFTVVTNYQYIIVDELTLTGDVTINGTLAIL